MKHLIDSSGITVGVIIPTHNRVEKLPAALASVLQQTWSDLHVLIVDDGSTDATPDYLRQLSDSRISSLRLEPCQGAGAARNAGLQTLTNRWIAFQDSDDVWHPDKLEKQMRALERAGPRAGFAYCRCQRCSGDHVHVFPPHHVARMDGDLFDVLLGGNLVTTQTAVVRRECIAAAGLFDVTLPPLEDWEFFLRLAQRYEAVFVDEILVDAPYSEDSISKRADDKIAALQAILLKYADEYALRPALHARHLGTLGDWLCMADRWAEGRRHFGLAARTVPGHVGHSVGALLSCCPPAYHAARHVRGMWSRL